MRRLGGDHLHEVAVLQRCGQGTEAIVDAHPLAVVAHLAVDPVGEVHGGGALAQADHITFGREDEHLIVKEVLLDRLQVVVVVLAPLLFLPVHQLPEPVEAGHFIAVGRRAALLVFPVGGDAVLRHFVHLSGADLHLHRPVPADHRRVQGLIPVGFGQADVVLEPTGDGAEGVVYHRQGAVAGLHGWGDDPQGRHVIDLVEGLLLALHLAPDAVEVFRPALHLAVPHARGFQPVAQQLHRHPQPFLPVAALAGHLLLHAAEGFRFQHLEGQILQLPLEAADAQPIGQRGVDVAGFGGDALLLLRPQRPEGAHVVQAVRQLHQHDADVAGHGQEHLAQVFRLGFGAIGEVNAAQFGDPFH